MDHCCDPAHQFAALAAWLLRLFNIRPASYAWCPGTRLQLNSRPACLIPFDQWTTGASFGPWQDYAAASEKWHGQHGHRLKRLLRRADVQPEVIYSPFFDALLGFPQIPQLITCHDLTPLRYPNSFKAWLKYRLWQPRHLARATQLIAISQHVADQLIAFGVPADRVVVIPNGIEVVRPPVPAPASEDLLVIARHDANKNLLGLLHALAFAQQSLPDWRGVMRIVGRGVVDSLELQAMRLSLPRPEGLELLQQLDFYKLQTLLRSSLALVSASLEEGFDYPVLEAKAEGIPTLLSDIPVHAEFHAGSSLFFPVEGDGAGFASVLSRLLKESRIWWELSTAGRNLALSLSVTRQQRSINSLMAHFI